VAKKILSIAADDALRVSRQLILERAGFEVVSASSLEDAVAICQNAFALFILGQTSSPDEQVRLARILRKKSPGIPLLELHSHGTPYVPKSDYSVETLDGPEALVLTVQRILQKAEPASEKKRPKVQTA